MARFCLALLALLLWGSACNGKPPGPGTLSVDPTAIDFGTVTAGDTVTRQLTLRNGGGAPTTLGELTLPADGRGAFAVGDHPREVAAGGELTLDVSYTAPAFDGQDQATLVIHSSAAEASQLPVTLKGQTVGGLVPGELPTDAGSPCPGVAGVAEVDFGTPDSYHVGVKHVWNGTRYAVAWAGARPGSAFNPVELHFGFLERDGRLVSGSDVVVPQDGGRINWWTQLAWSGREYGIVSSSLDGDGGVSFSRISAEGQLVPSSQRRVTDSVRVTTGALDLHPGLAWNPQDSEWGVSWERNTEVMFARLDPQGGSLGGPTKLGNGRYGITGNSPLIWAGTGYATVWKDDDGVRLVELDHHGKVLGSAVLADAGVSIGQPTLAFSGSDYGVVWSEYTPTTAEAHFARVRTGPRSVAGSDIVISGPGWANAPTIGWGGSAYLVAYDAQPDGGQSRIAVVQVGPGGAVSSARELTCSPGYDSSANLVWNGSVFSITYSAETRGPYALDGRILFVQEQ